MMYNKHPISFLNENCMFFIRKLYNVSKINVLLSNVYHNLHQIYKSYATNILKR